MDRNTLSARLADLSPAKRALLDLKLKGKRLESLAKETIPRRKSGGPAPLSYAQQRLWFLHQFEPNSPAYGVYTALRLGGPLKIDALQKALDTIVTRHEVLRTNFVPGDGIPLQIVAARRRVELALVDLTQQQAADREQQINSLIRKDALRPFDLSCEPLVRAKLLQLASEDHVLVLTMHHIVSDGWSAEIFFTELSELYDAIVHARTPRLADLPIQYADFAVWQRAWLQGEILETQLAYWKTQLDHLTTLKLPADRPRPPLQSFCGAAQSAVFPHDLTQAIKRISRQEGVTVFMTLLAAFQTLLHRYTGQDDIVVGCPVAGRTRAEVEELIGFFVNTLVLRADLSGKVKSQISCKSVRR